MQTASQQEIHALEACLRNGSLSVLDARAKHAVWDWCGRNKGLIYRERVQALLSVPLLAVGIHGILYPEFPFATFNLWQHAVDTAQPLLAVMADSLGTSETRIARLRYLPISLLNRHGFPSLHQMVQAEPWLPPCNHLQTQQHWLAWESLLYFVFELVEPTSAANWHAISRTLSPFANKADRLQVFIDCPLLAREEIASTFLNWRVAQDYELTALLSAELPKRKRIYIALRLFRLLVRQVGPEKCLKHFIDRAMEHASTLDWHVFSKEALPCGSRIAVQLANFRAIMEDGAAQRTCLLESADHYATLCRRGQALVFSLRGADNQKRCSTLHIDVDRENQSLHIHQHSGPENSEPTLACQQAAAILVQTLQASLPLIMLRCKKQSAEDAEKLGSCFNAIPDLARQLPWLISQAEAESAALLLADMRLADTWARVGLPEDIDGNEFVDWINANGGNWPAWDEAMALEARIYPDAPSVLSALS